ncbi:hypothetical protein ACLKA7_007574 [Drosophila subpalustris]
MPHSTTTIPVTHPRDLARLDSTRFGDSETQRLGRLLGLQLIAIELVKELSNFSLNGSVENEIENGKPHRPKTFDSATLQLTISSSFFSFSFYFSFFVAVSDFAHFRLASGWRLRTAFKSGRA